MSKPIGRKGLARISDDNFGVLVFAAATAATKVQALDRSKSYAVIFVGAGPSDVTLAASKDSQDAISEGTAKYAATKTYAALPAAGGFAGVVSGVTAVKITHIKSGAGVDDAPTVVKLGGRFQARFIETADLDNTTGLGDYTALTAT